MPSEILGTMGLWLALAASIGIALARRPSAQSLVAAINPGLATLALQSLHFTEEFRTGFYESFPRLLGLALWSENFFVTFNAVWISAWVLALLAASTRRATLIAASLLWFLGLAAIANGIVHPLLSLVTGSYFPGLLTAPILGVAGFFLVRSLLRVE